MTNEKIQIHHNWSEAKKIGHTKKEKQISRNQTWEKHHIKYADNSIDDRENSISINLFDFSTLPYMANKFPS